MSQKSLILRRVCSPSIRLSKSPPGSRQIHYDMPRRPHLEDFRVSLLCRLAAPGMMKIELGLGSLWLEVGLGSEADESLEPRDRVSVWPGRRHVPGIVAPEPWGARGAECLPRDVLRRSSPATSSCDGTTVHRCLCHGTESGTTEARPPKAVYPRCPMGMRGLQLHEANPGPDFRRRTLPNHRQLGLGGYDERASHCRSFMRWKPSILGLRIASLPNVHV